MSVLVDTPVWSQFFRRPAPDSVVIDRLRHLILDGDALLLGMIRQEILSGIKDRKQFERLRNGLRSFPDVDLEAEDHENAAEMLNLSRAQRIQGSNTDFLICAVSKRLGASIYTLDGDFEMFAKVLPIRLYADAT